jgi:hypothetical protein
MAGKKKEKFMEAENNDEKKGKEKKMTLKRRRLN